MPLITFLGGNTNTSEVTKKQNEKTKQLRNIKNKFIIKSRKKDWDLMLFFLTQVAYSFYHMCPPQHLLKFKYPGWLLGSNYK